MVTNYQRGRRAEWRARDKLEKQGFLVVRSAGSKSPVDLVAVGATDVFLIQVKTAAELRNRVSIPENLTAVRRQVCTSCVHVQLWVWYSRLGWKIFDVET